MYYYLILLALWQHSVVVNPLLLVSAKNAKGMKEHRQAVKCEARNPCKVMPNNRTPWG